VSLSGQHTGPSSNATVQARIERDALGTRAIPATALYGIHTARAVENLSFSSRPLGGCPPYVRALATVKRATARANMEAHVLDPEPAQAIIEATAPLLAGELLEHFPVDLLGGGGSIGVHMNVNEVLANLANERLGGRRGDYAPVHPRGHVGASQSTADVCHTALRIAIITRWRLLHSALEGVTETLNGKAHGFADVPTLARTCLQDAMPTTLAVLCGGYATLLGRRTLALQRAVDALRSVSLGGTVIGSGEGAPETYRQCVVSLLGETAGCDLVRNTNASDALQNSDDVRSVSGELAALAEALIKIAQDLRLLASGPQGGFAELILPHVQEGSSFFAGKHNPVVPETVLQCAFQVLGCDRAVQAAVEHAELYLNVFDGLAVVNILDAIEMLTRALRGFDIHCLRGLEANESRCRSLAAMAHGS
jgi:aspartate ammonia-lyase